jgi:putative transcriptional regulator
MGKLRAELQSAVAVHRLHLGLTQEQLAQAAEVSRQTIVAIESGTYNPSTVLALRLSLLLAVPVDQLFQLPQETQATLLQARQHWLEQVQKPSNVEEP